MIAAAQAGDFRRSGETRRRISRAPPDPGCGPPCWAGRDLPALPKPNTRTAAQRSYGSNLFREKKERLDLDRRGARTRYATRPRGRFFRDGGRSVAVQRPARLLLARPIG